ncbi:MAG: YbjN domain-containing protein [Myxococcales bacterium]|nr:YbjN domain-containing protein [Myxococcales bacterium]
MPSIFETMRSYFEQDDWTTTEAGDGEALSMGFQGDNGKWRCYAQAREDANQFIFYSVAPISVVAALRPVMAEFLACANYGLVIGNFEMDFSDGEVRYKTSIDVEYDRISPGLVQGCVYPNVLTMDKYLRGIMAVASGAVDVDDAIALVEGS